MINGALVVSSFKLIREEAASMWNELTANCLEVSLGGTPGEAKRSRVVDNRNPEWYRGLFEAYHNGRRGKKSRCAVRRVHVLKALDNMSKGVYYQRFNYKILIELIVDRVCEGYYLEEYGIDVPPQMNRIDLEKIQ